MLYKSILETIGNTPSVKINNLGPEGVDIYVKPEYFNPGSSVKDRLALNIINDGEASLDFSSGPIFHRDGTPPVEIALSNRLYPVARTLTDFMNYPESENAFLLSLKSLLPEIKFCFAK